MFHSNSLSKLNMSSTRDENPSTAGLTRRFVFSLNHLQCPLVKVWTLEGNSACQSQQKTKTWMDKDQQVFVVKALTLTHWLNLKFYIYVLSTYMFFQVTITHSGTNVIICYWWHLSNVYQIKLKLIWEKVKTRRKVYVDDYDHHNKISEEILLFSVPLPHQEEQPGHMQTYLLSYQIITGSYMGEKKVREKIYEFYCSI